MGGFGCKFFYCVVFLDFCFVGDLLLYNKGGNIYIIEKENIYWCWLFWYVYKFVICLFIMCLFCFCFFKYIFDLNENI